MGYILAKNVEDLDLSPIQAVIRNYGIPAINGYDVAAKDYNNQEWFKIGATYLTVPAVSVDSNEDSHPYEPEFESLSIMGTEKFARTKKWNELSSIILRG